MSAAPRVRLENVERYQRDVRLRLPFRFGVTTVTHATQAVIRAEISLSDGRRANGVAAGAGRKMVDKNSRFAAQNLDQLRQSLEIAIDLYRQRALHTLISSPPLSRQHARSAALGLNSMVASTALSSTSPSSMRSAAPSRSFADRAAECFGHSVPI